MAREQLRRLDERELRRYHAEDEPAVLALWTRALPRWPVSAGAFRARASGAEQLVMVVNGALVGYTSVARAETRAQLTAILVDPAYRRAGLASELFAQARRNLGGDVRSMSAGSGAGRYFWPGVPEDAPDGWAFLHAHGFEPTGEVADLLAGLDRFRAPEWVLSRAGDVVRFELATGGDASDVVALQARHFPDWKTAYEHQLALPGTVLVARRPCGASARDRPGDGRPCLRTAVSARRGGLLLRLYTSGGLVRPARLHALARLHHGQCIAALKIESRCRYGAVPRLHRWQPMGSNLCTWHGRSAPYLTVVNDTVILAGSGHLSGVPRSGAWRVRAWIIARAMIGAPMAEGSSQNVSVGSRSQRGRWGPLST